MVRYLQINCKYILRAVPLRLSTFSENTHKIIIYMIYIVKMNNNYILCKILVSFKQFNKVCVKEFGKYVVNHSIFFYVVTADVFVEVLQLWVTELIDPHVFLLSIAIILSVKSLIIFNGIIIIIYHSFNEIYIINGIIFICLDLLLNPRISFLCFYILWSFLHLYYIFSYPW